jgi:hypothetical protein
MKKEIKEGQIILGSLLTNEKAFITTSFGVYTKEGIYPICPVNPSRISHLLRKIMTLRGLGKYFTYDGKILPSYTSPPNKHPLTSCMLKALPIILEEDICGFLLRELQHTPKSVIKSNARDMADLFEILLI